MSCTVLVGGNFGDEGKGRIVSHVAHTDKPQKLEQIIDLIIDT